MKKAFFPLLLFTTLVCGGQDKGAAIMKFYGELGGGVSSAKGGVSGAGARVVLTNNWTFSLSGTNISMNPRNLPADYVQGFTLLIFIPVSDPKPDVDMSIFSVTAGRFFPAGRKVWFTTDAGLSVVSANEFQFRPNPDRGGLLTFPSNYTHTEERKTSIGAVLKVEANLAISNWVGFGIGTFSSLNGIQSPVGATFKVIIGKMGIRPRSR